MSFKLTDFITVSDTGNVGIGTDSIEGKLTLNHTAAELPSSGTSSNSAIQIISSLNNQLNIGLNTVSGDYGSYIQASDNNLAVPYPLFLQPNGGNIGIGTLSPTNLSSQTSLTIQGASVSRLDLLGASGAGGGVVFGTATAFTVQGNYGVPLVLDAGTTADMNFNIGGSTKLTIASGGNATFSGDIIRKGNVGNISFEGGSVTNINAQIQYDQVNDTTGQLFFKTANSGTLATRLTISSGGNVGIGKSPSTFRLDLETTSGGNGLKITRGTADFQVFQVANGASYVGTGNADTLHLITGGSSKMSIASNGVATFSNYIDTPEVRQGGEFMIGRSSNIIRVGSGDASDSLSFYAGASERLTISSGGATTLFTNIGSGLDNAQLTIKSDGSAVTTGLMFVNAANTSSFNDLAGIASYIESGNAKGNLKFWTRNSDGNNNDRTTRLTISSGGEIQVGENAALVFGTNNATDPYIQAASSGDELFFGRANGFQMAIRSDNVVDFKTGIRFINGGNTTLDAYEEGTWTALLTTTGNPFNNQSNQTGNYTRIGNLVTIQAQVLLSGATSSGTGEVIITGLPFTCSSSQAAYGSFNTGRVALSNTLGSSISVPASSNYIRFLFLVSGNNANVLDASALNGQSTPYMAVTITYEI